MSKATDNSKKAASKFTAEERRQMCTLAWIAGAAVSVTDQVGGIKAEAREVEALRRAVAKCFTVYQTKTNENLSAEEPSTFDFDKAESLLGHAAEQVLAMLEKKDTPQNVDIFKKGVLDVAFQVAAAYGAGFLGRGDAVSASESAMIDKVAQALKATHLVDAVKAEATVSKTK
ncbi:MAG: hypothetical protein HYV09_11050 [Deltaproteobacteria bacterium]|nr:hypothetical protein [Deltaproteobacteria bacterium]